jgi:hypothetical protein
MIVTENPLRGNERLNDMPAVKLRASTILRAFHEAEAELVGKAVILSDGKAGTVEIVSLDEDHGLRISIGGHVGNCRFCCKTQKLLADEFLAEIRGGKQSPIRVASLPLAKSPVSLR